MTNSVVKAWIDELKAGKLDRRPLPVPPDDGKPMLVYEALISKTRRLTGIRIRTTIQKRDERGAGVESQPL